MTDASMNLEKLLEYLEFGDVQEQAVDNENPRYLFAKKYATRIKNKDPELYDTLMRQASFALDSIRNKKKAADVLGRIDALLKQETGIDPRRSGDTYGVRLFIDYLANDPDYAGKAKNFYQRAIEQLLKKSFGES